MKQLIELIITELVEDKKSVEIEETSIDGFIDIHIKVSESDKGKVIGKKGKIINSIRTIAKACAIKEDIKVNISI